MIKRLLPLFAAASFLLLGACSSGKLAQNNDLNDDVYNSVAKAREVEYRVIEQQNTAVDDQPIYQKEKDKTPDYVTDEQLYRDERDNSYSYNDDDDYYDQNYSARINRFRNYSPWRSYNDSYYDNSFDPYYSYNYFNAPIIGLYIGAVRPYNFYNSWDCFGCYGNFNYNYWGPYSAYNPYNPYQYYGGGYGNYYGGGGYYGGNYSNPRTGNVTYGPRPSRSGIVDNNRVFDNNKNSGTRIRSERWVGTSGSTQNGNVIQGNTKRRQVSQHEDNSNVSENSQGSSTSTTDQRKRPARTVNVAGSTERIQPNERTIEETRRPARAQVSEPQEIMRPQQSRPERTGVIETEETRQPQRRPERTQVVEPSRNQEVQQRRPERTQQVERSQPQPSSAPSRTSSSNNNNSGGNGGSSRPSRSGR